MQSPIRAAIATLGLVPQKWNNIQLSSGVSALTGKTAAGQSSQGSADLKWAEKVTEKNCKWDGGLIWRSLKRNTAKGDLQTSTNRQFQRKRTAVGSGTTMDASILLSHTGGGESTDKKKNGTLPVRRKWETRHPCVVPDLFKLASPAPLFAEVSIFIEFSINLQKVGRQNKTTLWEQIQSCCKARGAVPASPRPELSSHHPTVPSDVELMDYNFLMQDWCIMTS